MINSILIIGTLYIPYLGMISRSIYMMLSKIYKFSPLLGSSLCLLKYPLDPIPHPGIPLALYGGPFGSNNRKESDKE